MLWLSAKNAELKRLASETRQITERIRNTGSVAIWANLIRN